MVIGHDPNFFKSNESQVLFEKRRLNPAPRLDRLAAAIIDFVIVFTISKLIASKSLLALKIALSFDLDYTAMASVFNLVWLGFSVYLIYTVLSHRILGCTLGQFFFSIRIIDIDSNFYKKYYAIKSEHDLKLLLIDRYNLVLRILLNFIGIFFVFPLISVFTNPDGRTFYDKICDSLVVTLRKDADRKNFSWPLNKLVGSILVLSFFSILSLISIYFMNHSFKFSADFKNSAKVCAKLSPFHDAWVESGIEESRLEVALALYSAGELSVECLTQEIDFEFNLNPDNPTAFFAKGLLSFENDVTVIKYFKKACQLDSGSAACKVSSWISFWPNFYEGEDSVKDYEGLQLAGEDVQNKRVSPVFLKVWLIKRHYQKGSLNKLASYLENLKVPKGLEGFFAEHLMRVELFQGKADKFDQVLKITENLNQRSRNLTESFCAIAIGESCTQFKLYPQCQFLKITRKSDKHLQNMVSACLKEENRIFATDPKHESFYLTLARRENYILDDLKDIFMDSENSFGIRFATLSRFFNFVSSIEYLNLVKSEWEVQESKDFFWRITGEKIKSKYIELEETQSSFNVYKALAKEFDELLLKEDMASKSIKLRNPAQSLSGLNKKSKKEE